MNRPQKYSRQDPFPQLPFHCEELEGVPTWKEALCCVLVVAFITAVFFVIMGGK
jgi:hypothetical protein